MLSADRDRDQQRGHLPAPFDYPIRHLQPADLAGISRVHWRACSTAYQFMNWSYTEDEVRRWYAGKLGEWDWGRVVCASETIVAFLAPIGAHIDQLFVDPDHQRVGVGSALLRVMLERRLRPATLQVFAQNMPARGLL
jgi:ribosomal protein S18 acetylase RimI-like enzyme